MAVLMREALGVSLRRARTARRRTLRDVSRTARVSLGYLSEVERGRKEPSSELLAAICEALDLALHELLSEAAESMAAESMAESMAAEALLASARSRRPVGLRHMDLRLATASGAAVPLSTPIPALPSLVPAGPVTMPAPLSTRPAGQVRVAA
jgi:transcriptional regulator with XRE-family HTH domain